MKKILLVVLMFITFTTFSQESKQIMESYTIAKYYDSDANSTDWNEVDEIRIFFNYSGDENIIKIYQQCIKLCKFYKDIKKRYDTEKMIFCIGLPNFKE